jgi:hypothetical protein
MAATITCVIKISRRSRFIQESFIVMSSCTPLYPLVKLIPSSGDEFHERCTCKELSGFWMSVGVSYRYTDIIIIERSRLQAYSITVNTLVSRLWTLYTGIFIRCICGDSHFFVSVVEWRVVLRGQGLLLLFNALIDVALIWKLSRKSK